MKVENHTCLNCGHVYTGTYCDNCGQKAIDNTDRSLRKLIGDFFGNILFLDNRFYLSLRYLLVKPGQMSVEFLAGKRKKFLPPVTFFLFVNLVYFLINPITDYSLPLQDQVQLQPLHSKTAKRMVDTRLEERGISFKEYARKYNSTSDNISRTVMILNVPMMALFIFFISFKRYPFYFDSLIFSFHYFTFFLLSVSVGDLIDDYMLDPVTSWIGIPYLMDLGFPIFILIVPILYASLYIRKFLSINWGLSILAGIYIYITMFVAQFVYRAIMFFLTFYFT